MITRLHGTLLSKAPPWLVVDVNGLAYEVEASLSTFYQLADAGEKITLHTHMVVREDAQLLYGFAQLQERSLFRNLIKSSGVGPKLALAILSGIEPDNFVQCIMADDSQRLTKVPGVGKKTAERLIVEMRDRVRDWQFTTDIKSTPSVNSDQALQEAIGALVGLGYKPNEARQAATTASKEHTSSEAMIRHALRLMLKK